jgi:hypothetical protein
VFAGPEPNAVTTVMNAVAQFPATFTPAAGLSPFGTFDVNFAGLNTAMANAGTQTPIDLILVMQLETEPSTAPLPWVTSCNETTAAKSP